jgi:hypothetical protein
VTLLARLNAEYQQAKRELAAGLICQADLDRAENQLDQALTSAVDRTIPQEN